MTPERMWNAVRRLERRIQELEQLDPGSVSQPDLDALECAIGETLEDVFQGDDGSLSRYARARTLLDQMALYSPMGAIPFHEVRNQIAEGRERSIALLKQACRGLAERSEMAPVSRGANVAKSHSQQMRTRKVFVVHGHDEAARELLAAFLRKADFEPVILHERANQGRTIIEKVEAHGDAGFAVVLLTPDDVGSVRGGDARPRARQNVLLELGYFVGRLGRKHVCALKRGDLEIPSDWLGVVHTELDPHGGWRTSLARELEAAGHEIDWRKALA